MSDQKNKKIIVYADYKKRKTNIIKVKNKVVFCEYCECDPCDCDWGYE